MGTREEGRQVDGRTDPGDDAPAIRRLKLAVSVDPILRSIVDRLLLEPASAAEIAANLKLDAQAVRHRLRRLVKGGLATREDKTRRRGASEFLYSCALDSTSLSAAELAELAPNQVELAVGRVLRTLFRETMAAVESGSYFARDDFVIVRFPIPLDEGGLQDASVLHDRLRESVAEAGGRARARLSRSEVEPIEATAAILFFDKPGPIWPSPLNARELSRRQIRRRSTQNRDDAVIAQADPVRLKIVEALNLFPVSAVELAERIGAPLERVRYELRALQRAAMIKVHSQRESRGAIEKVYLADSRKMTSFPEDVPPGVAGAPMDWAMPWTNKVFSEAVDAVRDGSFRDSTDWQLSRLPMRLDACGFEDVAALLNACLSRLFDLREECFARLEGCPPTHVAVSDVLLFERAHQMVESP